MAKPIVIKPPVDKVRMEIPSNAVISPLPVNMPMILSARTSPNVDPYAPGTWKRPKVGSTLQAAPVVKPVAEGAKSVADIVRAKKDSYLTADGFQVTGDYTQAIRKDAAGQLYIAPPSMPTAGYSALAYPYPDPKMRVGAALAGTPFPGGTIPEWVKGSGYYIPESPAEHRKAQMATLMGLGATFEQSEALNAPNDSAAVAAALAVKSAGGVNTVRTSGAEVDPLGMFVPAGDRTSLPAEVKIIRAMLGWKEARGRWPGPVALAWLASTRYGSIEAQANAARNPVFIDMMVNGQPPPPDVLNDSGGTFGLPPNTVDLIKVGAGVVKDVVGGGGSGGQPGPNCAANPTAYGCPGYKPPQFQTEASAMDWVWPVVGVAGVVALIFAFRASK